MQPAERYKYKMTSVRKKTQKIKGAATPPELIRTLSGDLYASSIKTVHKNM